MSNSILNALGLVQDSIELSKTGCYSWNMLEPRVRIGRQLRELFVSNKQKLVPFILLGLLAGFSPVSLAKPLQPNLVFLLTDDQRWDTLGSYGNHLIHTPNIDALAGDGVVFDNMFVTTSICAPSRASILTGQYVRRHGIWDFQTELTAAQLSKSYLGILKEAGYKIAFIGKWGVGKPPAAYFDFDRTFPGQGQYFVQVGGEKRHLTSVMGDQALEFLETTKSDIPFCLSVSFKAAHVQDSYDLGKEPFPFDPDLKHLYENVEIPLPATSRSQLFERLPLFLQNSENRMRWAVRFWGPRRYQDSVKGYYRLISGVDLVVGRILETLTDRSLLENTIIILTGDNGFFLGEFGLAGKWLPHEASIRVPLVIFDPRLPSAQRDQHRPELALNIDLAPTLLGLAGMTPPDEMQGRDLSPLLKGEQVPWRTEFFYEHHYKHRRIPPTEAVRTNHWKYIRYLETQPLYEELYDLRKDPSETNNLSTLSEYQPQLLEMRTKWTQLREQAGN
jgi:arylsulfatase A-like enzyme